MAWWKWPYNRVEWCIKCITFVGVAFWYILYSVRAFVQTDAWDESNAIHIKDWGLSGPKLAPPQMSIKCSQYIRVRVMVFNTTFNNNSVISWWSFQYVFFRNKYYLHIYFIATNQQSQILDSNEIPLCLPEYTYNVSLYSYAYLSLKRPQTKINKNINLT